MWIWMNWSTAPHRKGGRFLTARERLIMESQRHAWGVIKAILNDENRIIPVSTLLEGEYGEQDVYAGGANRVKPQRGI